MARILQVFRPRSGGTFVHVRVLATELTRRGHEVAVCGPSGEGFDVPLLEAEIPRAPTPARTLGATRAVARAYRSFQPDLIHAHGAQAGVVARLTRAAAPGVPLVHTPHRYAFDDGAGRSPANLAAWSIERALMPLATRVLCVCEAERRIAVRLGARDRARVVHNGIDPVEAIQSGAPDPRFEELASAGPLIVAVSGLFRRKGIPVLIEAMPAILAAVPDASLVVAGDGPERGDAERARDRSGVAERIHLAGHVDDPGALLGIADVFVNPALAESFSYGILEAMAHGCACVVTDAGGSAEAITPGVCGHVVPVGDAAALAEATIDLLADRERADRFGEAAAARVRERFTREHMVDGTEAVYRELAIGPGGRIDSAP